MGGCSFKWIKKTPCRGLQARNLLYLAHKSRSDTQAQISRHKKDALAQSNRAAVAAAAALNQLGRQLLQALIGRTKR